MNLRAPSALLLAALLPLGCLCPSAAGAQGRRGRGGAAARGPRQPPAEEDGRAAALLEEGLRQADAGNWAEAVKAFRQVVAVSPRHPEARVHLGDALMNSGDYEQAFAAYREAVRVAPSNPDAHYSLGAAFNDMAQYGDAFRPFVQAIRLDPEYAEAYYGIGYAYQRLDNYKEALGYLRSALRLRPDYPEARLSLGLTYLGLGDRKAAEEQLRLLEGLDAGLARTLRNELGVAAPAESAARPARREPDARPAPASGLASGLTEPPRREERARPAAEPKPAATSPKGRARPGAADIAVELAFWDSIKNSTDPEEFAAYLRRYPEGQFADLARIRSRALAARTGETTAPAFEADSPPAAREAAPAPRDAESNPAEPAAKETTQAPAAHPAGSDSQAARREPSAASATPSSRSLAQPASAPPAAPAPASTASTETAPPAAAASPPAAAPAARPDEPERPATLEETLEWLRGNFSNRFNYSFTARGEDPAAAPSTHEARITYEPVLFQGCNLEWRDAADTLSVSLSELDPQDVRVERRAEPGTTFSAEVWNLLLSATGGARAFREIKGDGSGAMNSYHSVTLQFASRQRAERLAERLRHAIKLCGGKTL